MDPFPYHVLSFGCDVNNQNHDDHAAITRTPEPSNVTGIIQQMSVNIPPYVSSDHVHGQLYPGQIHPIPGQYALPSISLPPRRLSRASCGHASLPVVQRQPCSMFASMPHSRTVMDIASDPVVARSTISSGLTFSPISGMMYSGTVVPRTLHGYSAAPSLGIDSSIESVTSEDTNTEENSYTNRWVTD